MAATGTVPDIVAAMSRVALKRGENASLVSDYQMLGVAMKEWTDEAWLEFIKGPVPFIVMKEFITMTQRLVRNNSSPLCSEACKFYMCAYGFWGFGRETIQVSEWAEKEHSGLTAAQKTLIDLMRTRGT